MKKLSQPTGSIEKQEDETKDSEAHVVRTAILVHAGPGGEKIEFQSGDGPISFDSDRIKSIVDVHNQRLENLAKDYGGIDKIPMGAYEPILDSHANDSNDRIIGRLTGPLKFEVRDVPKVGENVPCAVAEGITFLGKDTVDRVKDGRIYHLSIGINESDNSLGEISTVVQPAASGAMLLKQKQTKGHGGSKMNAEVKRMQSHSERLSKLSQMKEGISTLLKKADSTQSLIKLNSNKQKITHKLRMLSQSGRIGRAEYKELLDHKLMKLAAMGDSELDTTLSLLDTMKPDQSRVKLSQQFGSTSASDVMEFGNALAQQKDLGEYKRLRKEIAGDFKKLTGKKLVEDEDHEEHSKEMSRKLMKDELCEMSGPEEKEISPGKDEHVVPGQEKDEAQLAHHMAALAHHLSKGDIESAKEVHASLAHHLGFGEKHMSEFAGDVKSEDEKAHSADVQGQVDELKTQLSRLAGMVSELIGSEEKEGEHFGEISKEHEEVAQE